MCFLLLSNNSVQSKKNAHVCELLMNYAGVFIVRTLKYRTFLDIINSFLPDTIFPLDMGKSKQVFMYF